MIAQVQSAETQKKLQGLKIILEEMSSVIVAYSGGVDSTLVSVLAREVLAEKSLAVTASSPSIALSELQAAIDLAKGLSLYHRVIETAEMERPEYRENSASRCFFCKDELYTRLSAIALQEGFQYIVNGTNADDLGDFRPGIKAASKYGVRSPLVEAELSKKEVRIISRSMGIPIWDKPAQACLSSRIPYGTPVSVEALTRIFKAEEILHGLGFRQVRVRHHENIARIEVDPDEFPRLLKNDVRSAVSREFRSLGYAYVTFDLEGFRSGSLNEVLTSLSKVEKT